MDMSIVNKAMVCFIFIEVMIILITFFLSTSVMSVSGINETLSGFKLTQTNLQSHLNSTVNAGNSFNSSGWLSVVTSGATCIALFIGNGIAVLLLGVVAYLELIFEVIPGMLNVTLSGGLGTIFGFIVVAINILLGLYAISWIISFVKKG